MKRIGFLALLISLSAPAFACPELNEDELGDDTMVEIDVEDYVPSAREFGSLRGFNGMDYDRCRNYIEIRTIRAKSTGRIFKAMVSNDHACDGDNTYGSLLNANMTSEVGQIGDSFISCEEPQPFTKED